MHPHSPLTARYSLRSHGATTTRPESDSKESMPKAKRVKHSNASPLQNSTIFPPSPSSALPEEILLSIFSHINPFTNRHINLSGNAIWSPSEILNVALICRRFYKLVTPELAKAFESWCHPVSGSGVRKRKQGWSPCLRAVLRQPVLGGYLRQVEMDLRDNYCWNANTWGANERRDLDNWLESDFELADKAVDELCKRDIWKEFPTDSTTGVQCSESLKVEAASQEWSACIRAGRSDAILALLVALAPNMEELTLSSSNAENDEHGHILLSKNTWMGFVVGVDSNYLERVFRGATNSQLAALKDESKLNDSLLPSLVSIRIRTQGDDKLRLGDHTMSINKVLPYLTLPSLEYASIKALKDDSIDDVLGVNLFLKNLDVNYTSLGVYGTGRLLRCCPNIEHLSYSSTGETDEDQWADLPALVPHLASIAPQLKSFTLADTDFVGMDGGMDDPGIEDIASFVQLTSLDIRWEHIHHSVVGGSGALWRMLPPSLQRLTIRNIWNHGFSDILEEVKALKVAREEGLVPNLREVVIGHERTRKRIEREEERADFEAMEEACREAPVCVEQIYEDP